MSSSSSGRSWKSAPQWFRAVMFVAALGVSVFHAVRLGGATNMDPWLLLVLGMLAGRLLHYLLPTGTDSQVGDEQVLFRQ